jgi:hypothetical protein
MPNWLLDCSELLVSHVGSHGRDFHRLWAG